MTPTKKKKLWKRVCDAIKEDIIHMSAGQNKLPTEHEYATRFDVSRYTVREALQSLTMAHYVTARHGKGSFAHPSAIKLQNRIDINFEFQALLSTSAEKAQCTCLQSGAAKNTLNLNSSSSHDVYRQIWAFSVQGENRILYLSETPLHYIDEKALTTLPQDSFLLFDWLVKACHIDTAYFSVSMTADINAQMAEYFKVDPQSPLLVWDEIVYDINDRPVSNAKVFFHPKQPICQCVHM